MNLNKERFCITIRNLRIILWMSAVLYMLFALNLHMEKYKLSAYQLQHMLDRI